MFEKWKLKIKDWLKLLNPPPKIGGLEITDHSIRYLVLGQKLKQASLRLPAGIIEDGQIKNKDNFVAALTSLHKQITRFKKPLNVIVSISAANVYTQVFSLPLVARGKIDQAARLNLQMISPIDVNSAYYDWQLIGEESEKKNRLDLMGAFAVSKFIDDLVESLSSARFVTVAVESAPSSLSRAISHLFVKELAGKPHLVFSLSTDGLDFFILKDNDLYFNRFISWTTLQGENGGGKVDFAVVKDVVNTELKKILNFYTSKWGGVIEDLVLVSATSNKELVVSIKKNLKIDIHEFSLSKYPDLTVSWGMVLGVALRGLVPRAKDHFISLISVGTEERFQQSRILGFASFWRSVILALLAGMFLIYGVFDFALARSLSSLNRKLETAPVGLERDGMAQLEREAKEFNLLVKKALDAKSQSLKWSPFFRLIRSLAGRKISLTQIYLQQENLVVSLEGSTNSEGAVISFKNLLIKEKNIEDISLPLTSIQVDSSGRANFKVTFKLKKWPL